MDDDRAGRTSWRTRWDGDGLGLLSRTMLVWLNGPFGVGKTAAAEALVARLPKSMVFDPEPLGSMLRQVARTIDPIEDFQDLRPWRLLVPETVRVLRDAYGSIIVMPLTVWRRAYIDELVSALRSLGELRCFRLTASEDRLRARILNRPTADGPHDWCLAHVQTGLDLMRDANFGEEIATDERSPEEVANAIEIALGSGAAIAPGELGRGLLAGGARRA